MNRDELLAAIKAPLVGAFGERLKGIVLYGSEARGESEPDSDIDVLVLLKGPIRLGRDLRCIIHELTPLQLKIFRPIHAMPVNVKSYQAGDFAHYRHAKKEGIPA